MFRTKVPHKPNYMNSHKYKGSARQRFSAFRSDAYQSASSLTSSPSIPPNNVVLLHPLLLEMYNLTRKCKIFENGPTWSKAFSRQLGKQGKLAFGASQGRTSRYQQGTAALPPTALPRRRDQRQFFVSDAFGSIEKTMPISKNKF